MSDNILISIIIPVYNLEEYLSPTLESLLREDLTDIEIIVIDDGSLDATFSIASSILDGQGVSYQIAKQDNAGVSAARNHGMSLASGEYIYFLDGDDIVKGECFNHIKQLIELCKYDLVSFGYDVIDECGNIVEEFDKMFSYPELDISIDDFTAGLVTKKYGVRIGTVVLKKRIIEENKLCFNVNSRYGEDVEFLYKYIISSSNLYFIKSSHLNYLLRRTSAMATKRVQIFDPVYAYDRVYEYFVERGCNSDMANLIQSISIPEAVVRCIMRGIREGQLKVGLGNRLPAGMKKRLQGVRFLAFDLNISMLLAIFMLIHFPGLFALIIKK